MDGCGRSVPSERERDVVTGRTTDFLVIGGGIIGVSLARELKSHFADASVTVLEKEIECGLHASGRNSGVLHAGFYYSADSLKARFTREGNERMTAFCKAEGIHVNECGKLVVARNANDLPGLEELLRRGRANGVEVHRVSAKEARELEPLARTHEAALWSPRTSSVNPAEVMRSLVRAAESSGIRIERGVSYRARSKDGVVTSSGAWSAGYVVNAAGLHADRVARDFGFSERYRILPFKGVYLKSAGALGLRRHVYPVPDPRYPFLGVHFTVTADGHVKIGPTAIPALWREQYSLTSGFSATELVDITWRQAGLLVRNAFDFRRLAVTEMKKYRRRHLVQLAAELVPSARISDFSTRGEPGIRAQLLDVRTGALEMDFKYEGDDRSFHILNAVSPAFTCALPFSTHLVGTIQQLMAPASRARAGRHG